jgi:hypothetical protein
LVKFQKKKRVLECFIQHSENDIQLMNRVNNVVDGNEVVNANGAIDGVDGEDDMMVQMVMM